MWRKAAQPGVAADELVAAAERRYARQASKSTMLIGDRQSFAIECYHEPLPNQARRVFGRMCLWVDGAALGDINEPACMLNVTEGQLQGVLARLDQLEDPSLVGLDARETFDFLDRALYLDEERSSERVAADAARFFRFDFLTNGGESFDRTKSFIVPATGGLSLLFRDDQNGFHSAEVRRSTFVAVLRGFLDWIRDEGETAG